MERLNVILVGPDVQFTDSCQGQKTLQGLETSDRARSLFFGRVRLLGSSSSVVTRPF